jgi:uncharacterized RDD family membrane protein YckC
MIGTVGGGSVPPLPPPAEAWPPPPPTARTGSLGPVGFVGYATFGRRVGAYILDAIPYLIIAAIGYTWALSAFSAALRGRVVSLSLPYLLLLFGPLLYAVVLWAMAAKGNSPGNALLGIRVVRDNGALPGVGLGLGRLLLKGLLIGITFYIGAFSPLWDKTGRRKGWWDSACKTVVLNRDAVDAYRAAVGAAGSAAAASAYPLPDAYPPDASSASASAGASSGWPQAAPEQPWVPDQGLGYSPTAGPGSTPLAGPGFPAAAGMPGVTDDRPAWDIAPVPAPDRVGAARPAAPAPVATWGDRPADPAMPSFAPAAGPPPPPPPPAGPAARHAAPPAADPGPEAGLPWASPAEPSVISSVPGIGSSWVTPPAEASPDQTRLRVAPLEPGSGWVVELDDGRMLTLAGKLILGRDPSALPEDGDATPVPIADDSRSVSKTHLLLEVGPSGMQVTDRHSTNGVVVVTAGVDLSCVPGVPTPLPDGSTVRFGDRSLRVRRQ